MGKQCFDHLFLILLIKIVFYGNKCVGESFREKVIRF